MVKIKVGHVHNPVATKARHVEAIDQVQAHEHERMQTLLQLADNYYCTLLLDLRMCRI